MVNIYLFVVTALIFIANLWAVPIAVSPTRPVNPEEAGYYEGDMVIPPLLRGVAMRGNNVRWPNGTVPYEISSQYATAQRDAIIFAMRTMESLTAVNNTPCVTFRERAPADNDYYIYIFNGAGCYSYVGRNTGITLNRTVSLQHPGCIYNGTIMHELLHTLGFYHEQARPDRETYVKINWDTIQTGFENNFQMYNNSQVDTLNTTYDYGSVMHYERDAFSKNGSDTIVPLLNATAEIGQRITMSLTDIEEVRIFYGCYNNAAISTISPFISSSTTTTTDTSTTTTTDASTTTTTDTSTTTTTDASTTTTTDTSTTTTADTSTTTTTDASTTTTTDASTTTTTDTSTTTTTDASTTTTTDTSTTTTTDTSTTTTTDTSTTTTADTSTTTTTDASTTTTTDASTTTTTDTSTTTTTDTSTTTTAGGSTLTPSTSTGPPTTQTVTSTSTGTISTSTTSTNSTTPTTTDTTKTTTTVGTTTLPSIIVSNTLTSNSLKYQRIGGTSSNYFYTATQLIISVSDAYIFTSSSTFAMYCFLYSNSFDPRNPSANLIAQGHNTAGNEMLQFTISLSAGGKRKRKRATSTYVLVSTTEDPGVTGPSTVRISGTAAPTIIIGDTGTVTTPGNNNNNNDDDNGKVIGIIVGSVIGGILLLICLCALCFGGVCSWFYCMKGKPLRSNKAYVRNGIGVQPGIANTIFQPGPFIGSFLKNGVWHGPQNLTLSFYPQADHTVYGKGTDHLGTFVATGVYSPRTLRIAFDKRYQTGLGHTPQNPVQITTVQLAWNSSTQAFEGKSYSRGANHREEQRYIIRKANARYRRYP